MCAKNTQNIPNDRINIPTRHPSRTSILTCKHNRAPASLVIPYNPILNATYPWRTFH